MTWQDARKALEVLCAEEIWRGMSEMQRRRMLLDHAWSYGDAAMMATSDWNGLDVNERYDVKRILDAMASRSVREALDCRDRDAVDRAVARGAASLRPMTI
jgi:hypothetical protein